MANPLILLCLVCFLAPSVQGKTNYVEIFFLVDRHAIQIYEREGYSLARAKRKMSQDIDYFLTEVNSIFQSLNNFGDNSVDVRIAKHKIKLVNWNLFTSSPVDAGEGLTIFDNYLAKKKSYKRFNYDLALLWTGFELYNKTTNDKAIAGLAHVGKVCKGEKATSIVEFDGTYKSVGTAAHEIAHNLGAEHDPEQSDYVMAPTSGAETVNRWSFSRHTARNISSTINNLSPNCLRTANSRSIITRRTVTPNLANPDTVCKRSMESQSSYMCRSSDVYDDKTPKGDEVCKRIQCRDGRNMCSQAFTSDGLLCGNQKSCNDGACVADTRRAAAVADENCIWGDQPEIGKTNPKTCAEFLAGAHAIACEQPGVRSACCATCKSKETGIEGCMYGDRSDVCTRFSASPKFCAINANTCCKLCHGVSRKRSADGVDVDVIRPDQPKIERDQENPESGQRSPFDTKDTPPEDEENSE